MRAASRMASGWEDLGEAVALERVLFPLAPGCSRCEFNPLAGGELRAVLTLLVGPGGVWELAFGSWVLLPPERINAYAQAVIRTLQTDEHLSAAA